MKIYTEVNYEWKDDQLVQTSSESFDYEGEVEQCGMFGGGGSFMNKIINKAKEDTAAATRLVQRNTRSIQQGPAGGVPKLMADKLYGGTFKQGVEKLQQNYRDTEDDFHEGLEHVQSLLTDDDENGKAVETTDDVTPEEREAILQQGLVAEGGRESLWSRKKASTGSTSSSILDPPTR